MTRCLRCGIIFESEYSDDLCPVCEDELCDEYSFSHDEDLNEEETEAE